MRRRESRGLDGVEVSLYRNAGGSWRWQRDVATDADGLYSIPVVAGEYRLSFSDFDNSWLFEWWNDADTLATATSVVVAGSNRTGIDAQLADGGVVTGAVTYPQQVTGWSSTVTLFDATTGEWAGQADVDAHQNRFRIDDLPTGTYRAEFSRAPGFDTAEAEFWNDRPRTWPGEPDRLRDRGQHDAQHRRDAGRRRGACAPGSCGTARAARWRGAG